jgi:hypothetical protein
MDDESDLVSAELAEQLVAACRTSVGDNLRSITCFTRGGFEQVYLRSDLESDADLAGFVELESDGFRASTAYRGSELGDYTYTVRAFENGYMTRVTSGDRGVFVTSDSLSLHSAEDVATALKGVMEAAEMDVEAESPIGT